MIAVELGTHVMLVALLVKVGVQLECAKAEGVAEGTQLPHRNHSSSRCSFFVPTSVFKYKFEGSGTYTRRSEYRGSDAI